jgi:hypothetical protein
LEKRGDEILKKSFPLKLLSQSQPNFAEMILGGPLPKFAHFCNLNLTAISYSFFKYNTKSIKIKKKIDRRAEPPDTFLEENHSMTISSKLCSY